MKTLTAKQKWIYSSSAVALLSMFLPWFVLGIRSDNGWETDYYVLLACWFVPLISAYNNFNWKIINRITILIGSLAFVVFAGDTASIRIFGDTYSPKVSAGVYVYLLAWSAAVYAEFMVSNEYWDANDPSRESMSISANEELFLQVEREFENNKIDEALWIKSLTICDGDKDKAKYRYIRDKVSKIEEEKINNIKKATLLDTNEEFKRKYPASDNVFNYLDVSYTRLKEAMSTLYKWLEEKPIELTSDRTASALEERVEKPKMSKVVMFIVILMLSGFVAYGVHGYLEIRDFSNCVEKVDSREMYTSNIEASRLYSERRAGGIYRLYFTAIDDSGKKVTRWATCDDSGKLLGITH